MTATAAPTQTTDACFAWAIDESTDGGRTWQWNQSTVTTWGSIRSSTPREAACWAGRRFRIDDNRTRITRVRVWDWTTDDTPTFDQIKSLATTTRVLAERSTDRSPADDGHTHTVRAGLPHRTARRTDDGAVIGYGTCWRCLQPITGVYHPDRPADQQEQGWTLLTPAPSPLWMPQRRPAHLNPTPASRDAAWRRAELVTAT